MPPSILVTGANGFVGRHLCRRLQQGGCAVRGAVRPDKADALPQGVSAAPIAGIDAATDWAAALDGIDAVVHLAARVHVMKESGQDLLERYRLVNVKGTERLAQAAAAGGVQRFVLLSSVKVNGEGRLAAYSESDKPAPMDSYGISKMEAENRLRAVAAGSAMEWTVLRTPLVYGPGVKANFLKLFRLVDRGWPLPLAGVANRRSFTFVGNLADALATVLFHPGAGGQTYMVSDGRDVSTPELIRLIAAAFEKEVKLFWLPGLLLHIGGRIIGKGNEFDRLLGFLTVDISKIQQDLDWKPPYSMEEGLRETAAWHRSGGEPLDGKNE
jgi:nucleoside-diphosphate-sugar epimerase